MKVTHAAALVLAAGLALSGCSGDDGTETDTDPTDASQSSPDVGVISPELPPEPEFKGKPKGIIADVTVDACSTDAGTVEASGSVTNSADRPRDLAVVMSWVTDTSDVLARGVVTLPSVDPGDTEAWSVEAELGEGYTVTCVPVGYSGELR